MAINQALHERAQMSFRLFYGEERVTALALLDESIQFQALECKEDEIGDAETCIADPAASIVDQNAERAPRGVDAGRRAPHRERGGVLRPDDIDESRADHLSDGLHFIAVGEAGLS
jgi:hypothetical protein